MKNLLFLLCLVLICFCSQAQQNDSTSKKDTVIVPIYEKTDTLPVNILYVGKKKNVHYSSGFITRKGFAIQDKNKGWQWAEQPQIVGYYDEKKNPIKEKVIQVF